MSVAFLERWEWYRSLPADLRSLVLETMSEISVEAGDYVARAGEPSSHWYGLISGYLQMYVVTSDGAETTLYCLREGEWGGEGSLLKQERRRYDLRALTAARICVVPGKTFDALRQQSIGFNHFICQIMNERMGVFVSMLAASRLSGPEMRVARALTMLVDHHGDDQQKLALRQHEIALICGLSRQRVNQALSQLKRLGILSSELSNSYLVVNARKLGRYVRPQD